MENKAICREAMALGLANTSTEFWNGQRISGLSPEDYLALLEEESGYDFEPCCTGSLLDCPNGRCEDCPHY